MLSTWKRVCIGVEAAVSSFRDPYRADMVAVLGEVTAPLFIERIRNTMLKSKSGREILRSRPNIDLETVEKARLCAPDTLGSAYIKFLTDNNVSPLTRSSVKYIDDSELAYVMTRYRQIHDFIHVCTGLPTTVEAEVLLKWFEWMQTGLPMNALASVFGPFSLDYEQRKFVRARVPLAIRSGLDSEPLINVYFETHLNENLTDFRNRLKIKALA